MNILHIDSSLLGTQSVSRALSAAIVARHRALAPRSEVVYRDLVADPPPPLSPAPLAEPRGDTTIKDALVQDLAEGNRYIDELLAADLVVIGAPMYNFSVAAQLKAWIDRIVVAGRTFRYGPQGPVGLVPGDRKVVIASSRGSVYAGPMAAFEHHETYLQAVLGFIGFLDIAVVRAEGLSISPESKAAAVAGAMARIEALAV